jgi:MobA/MobL family
VREFAEQITAGRASWLAAFHDDGNDRNNPHVHLVIRDRDPETGKRVCGMSERGSTDRLRELWERHANEALELAGRMERVDRRTLAAQGISRKPTIHEGLSAREMEIRDRRIRSKTVEYRNGTGARSKSRRVDYRKFDKGRSRPAYNRSIREGGAEWWAALMVIALPGNGRWKTRPNRTSRKTGTRKSGPGGIFRQPYRTKTSPGQPPSKSTAAPRPPGPEIVRARGPFAIR